jgi:hypothetical protein
MILSLIILINDKNYIIGFILYSEESKIEKELESIRFGLYSIGMKKNINGHR